jgi:hypothetical protein
MLSEVAFVRFASVYRQFQGIRDFADALQQLQELPLINGLEERKPWLIAASCGNSVAIFIEISGATAYSKS